MSSHAFADFLERLQADGQLTRCDSPLNPRLEIAAKAADVAPGALLATNVSGSAFPTTLGVFTLEERILRAFGASSVGEVAGRLDALLESGEGGTWLDRLGGDRSGALRKYQPRTVRTGPSQQIIRLGSDVDLTRLSAPTFHESETYPCLTAGRLITRAPDGRLHVGQHDFRIIDSDRLVACWAPSSEAARILAQYRRRGQGMPIAISFGGDPVDLLIATAPLPPYVDVLELAGYLLGKPRELISARRVNLSVPADAELVLEGTIEPNESPIAAGSGLDAMEQIRPLRDGCAVHIEAVTHRPTPLFPALLPGERNRIRRTLVKVFLPFLRRELPGLIDFEFPAFGGGGAWAFASIDKTYQGQAGQFANAFWALPRMLPVRYLVIVDEDVDVGDAEEVFSAVAAHAAPATDVRLGDVPPDAFLHETPPGRMVFDATRPVS